MLNTSAVNTGLSFFSFKPATNLKTCLEHVDAFSKDFFRTKNQTIAENADLTNLEKFALIDDDLIFDLSGKSYKLSTPLQKILAKLYNLIFSFLFKTKLNELEMYQQMELLKKDLDQKILSKDAEFLGVSDILIKKLQALIAKNVDPKTKKLAQYLIRQSEDAQRKFLKLKTIEQLEVKVTFPNFCLGSFEFATQKVDENGQLLKLFPHFAHVKELVKKAFYQNPDSLAFADTSLKKDKAFISELIDFSPKAFFHADKSIRYNDELTCKVVAKNANFLKTLPSSLSSKKPIILAALKGPNFDYKFLKPFEDDKEVLLAAIARGCPLKLIDTKMKTDPSFILSAMAIRGWDVYLRLSEDLQAHKEIKIAAYKKRYGKRTCSIQELQEIKKQCPELFSCPEFVLNFLEKTKKSLSLVNDDLIKSTPFILRALKADFMSIHEVQQNLCDSLDFMKQACKINGYFILRAQKEHLQDLELLEIALKDEPLAIYNIDLEDISPEIFKKLLFKVPQIFHHLEIEDLDHALILEFLTLHGSFFSVLPDSMKKNKDYIKAACLSYPRIVGSLKIADITDDEELLYRYLALKLPKTSVKYQDHYYLLLPFSDERFEEVNILPNVSGDWKKLVGGAASDLYEFIQNYTLEIALSLESHIDTEEKLILRKQTLLENLETLNQRLLNKTPYLGTPRADQLKQLDLFYESIYGYLNDLEPILTQDASMHMERLQILDAAGVCGGGLLAQLGELHDQLVLIQISDPLLKLAQKISESSVKKIASLNQTHDVHDTNENRFILNRFVLKKERVKDPLKLGHSLFSVLYRFLQIQTPQCVVLDVKQAVAEDEQIEYFIDSFCEDDLFEGPYEACEDMQTLHEIHETISCFEANKQTLYDFMPTLEDSPDLIYKVAGFMNQAGAKSYLVNLIKIASSHQISEEKAVLLFEDKEEIKKLWIFFQKLVLTTKKSFKEVVNYEKSILLELLCQNKDVWTKERLKKQFQEKDLDDDGLYLDSAYMKILTKLGFFKKI